MENRIRPTRRPNRTRIHTSRPLAKESLEARRMLTFCTVTSAAAAGPGTLANCFDQAGADSYNDVIAFSADLTGATINVSGLEVLEGSGSMFVRGGDRNITIDAGNADAHFAVIEGTPGDRTTLRVENLTLVNGSWASIYAADAELKLSGVTVENTSSGRAVQVVDTAEANPDPQVDIRHSAFRNNSAGALFIGHTGTHATVSGTTSGVINIAANEFSGNSVTGLVDGGAIEIRHNILGGTHALQVNIDNNTISNNSGRNGGGAAISGTNLDLRLLNNTVVNNVATNFAGGVYISSPGVADVFNNIMYDNSSPNGGRDLDIAGTSSGSHNVIKNESGFGGTYVSTNPNLAPLADNGGLTQTHALTAASINAKDMGLNVAWSSVHADGPIRQLGDQRGPMYSRIAGNPAGPDTIDIGAFECNYSVRGRAVVDSDRYPLGAGVGNVEVTATHATESPKTTKTTIATGMPVEEIDINGDGVIDAQTERGWYWFDDLTNDIWNVTATDMPGEAEVIGPVSYNVHATKTGELTNYSVIGVHAFTLVATQSVAQGAQEFATFSGGGGGVIDFGDHVGPFVGDEYLQSHGVTFDFGATTPNQWGVFAEGSPQTRGDLDGYDGQYRPDGDNVLRKWPNHQEPLTIEFQQPVAQIGSFIATGIEGNRRTVTIEALDSAGHIVTSMSGNVDSFNDQANREGFWSLRTDKNVISKVTIRNDNPSNYGNALIVDDVTWHRSANYDQAFEGASNNFAADFSGETRMVQLRASDAIVEDGFPTRWDAGDYSPSIITTGGTGVAAEGIDVGSLDGYDGSLEPDGSFLVSSDIGVNSSGMTIHFERPVTKVGGLSAIGGLPETSFVYSRLQVTGNDMVGNAVASSTLLLDPHGNLDNLEAFWALESSAGDITDVVIELVDETGQPVNVSHTMMLDQLRFVPPTSCDFTQDGVCDVADLDQLIGAISTGNQSSAFDLSGDGLVDLQDRDAWLSEAGAMNLPSGGAYLLADANLDGVVGGQDFIIWNAHKFAFTGKWSQGDFNADGTTDGQDFLIWNNHKFLSADLQNPNVWANADIASDDDQREENLVDKLFASVAF